MDSFQAKIGWKWMRKSKSKNSGSVQFLPEAEQKIPKKQQKNSKKIQKINKYRYGFISSLNRLGKDEKGGK